MRFLTSDGLVKRLVLNSWIICARLVADAWYTTTAKHQNLANEASTRLFWATIWLLAIIVLWLKEKAMWQKLTPTTFVFSRTSLKEKWQWMKIQSKPLEFPRKKNQNKKWTSSSKQQTMNQIQILSRTVKVKMSKALCPLMIRDLLPPWTILLCLKFWNRANPDQNQLEVTKAMPTSQSWVWCWSMNLKRKWYREPILQMKTCIDWNESKPKPEQPV